MSTLSYFAQKNVAILGLGISGIATAITLSQLGAHVTAWDDAEKSRKNGIDLGINVQPLIDIDWSSIDTFVIGPGIPHTYPVPHPIVSIAKSYGHTPVGDIECFSKLLPDATILAITGTNGKSTVASLVAHVLEYIGYDTVLCGNIGKPILAVLKPHAYYVLEISSYQLELTPSLHYKLAAITNISPDHMDRHGGMQGYIQAKASIIKKAEQTVIAIDDKYCYALWQNNPQIIPVSVKDSMPKIVEVSERNKALQGKHNLQNSNIAYAMLRNIGNDVSSNVVNNIRNDVVNNIGNDVVNNINAGVGSNVEKSLGSTVESNIKNRIRISEEQILAGLATFPGLAHRQQIVCTSDNITYVNDSKATNVESTIVAVERFKDTAIYLILGGRTKNQDITVLFDLGAKIRHVFVIGEARFVYKSIFIQRSIPFTLCESLEQACTQATAKAQARSEQAVVLLSPACSSFDQFANFEHRGEEFCRIVQQQKQQ